MAGIASAAIIGGAALAGSIGSSLLAKGGAAGAAGTSQEAANEAFQAGQTQVNRNQGYAGPYTWAGGQATNQIASLLGFSGQDAYSNALGNVQGFANASGAKMPTYMPTSFTETHIPGVVSNTFQTDPSYAWRMQQGVRAQDQSAAAKGTLLSGAQQQALNDYGQNQASQEYQNWYNRFADQRQYELAQNQANMAGNAAVNAQNFGQQQTLYGNQTNQWNNALSQLNALYSGGNSSSQALMGASTSAVNGAQGATVGGANAAAGYQAQGASDLASGVGAGANAALQAYLFRNYLSPGSGGGASGYSGLASYGAAQNPYGIGING
jgi:hypothetical protein